MGSFFLKHPVVTCSTGPCVYSNAQVQHVVGTMTDCKVWHVVEKIKSHVADLNNCETLATELQRGRETTPTWHDVSIVHCRSQQYVALRWVSAIHSQPCTRLQSSPPKTHKDTYSINNCSYYKHCFGFYAVKKIADKEPEPNDSHPVTLRFSSAVASTLISITSGSLVTCKFDVKWYRYNSLVRLAGEQSPSGTD